MDTNALIVAIAREMGLPKRLDWAKACARYAEGWSTTEIAVQSEVTAAVISWGLKKRGVVMRTPKQTMAMQARRGFSWNRPRSPGPSSPRCECGLVLRNLRVVHETPEGEICDMCWHRRQRIPWREDVNFFKEAA